MKRQQPLGKTTNLVVFKQQEATELSGDNGDLYSRVCASLWAIPEYLSNKFGIAALGEQLDSHKLRNFSVLDENNCYRVVDHWDNSSKPLLCDGLPGTKRCDKIVALEEEISGNFLGYQRPDPQEPVLHASNSLTIAPNYHLAHLTGSICNFSSDGWGETLGNQKSEPGASSLPLIACQWAQKLAMTFSHYCGV